MVCFIDRYRDDWGVEPICAVLLIAPSTYYRCKELERNPERRSCRARREEWLEEEIERVWHEHRKVYGARKVWKQLNRESITVGRCTVERLMRKRGLEGVRRGQRRRTTIPAEGVEKPLDIVCRQFVATRPNQLWVADITYVAFVIDVFSRYIVGWRVLKSLQTELVLDALEQALWARGKPQGVIHHSDRGSQYLSIRYTERLAEAGCTASVGRVGDSYDNALAETMNGLYKAEGIHKDSPWRTMEQVERATLTWVEWFNNRRILQTIGDVPPAEYELMYDQQTESTQAA